MRSSDMAAVNLDAGNSDWIKGGHWSMVYIDEAGESRDVETADELLVQLGVEGLPFESVKARIEGFMELRVAQAMPDEIREGLVVMGLVDS